MDSPRTRGVMSGFAYIRCAVHVGCTIGIVLALAPFVTGCEENLRPTDSIDLPFTMYGVFSPDLDTQTVRLYMPEESPTLGISEALDADVYSIDVASGERRLWKDSVVVGPGGQVGHVFWSPFRVAYGRMYRIEAIRRSDGARSFADVNVPPHVSVRIDETDAPLLHVYVEGGEFSLLTPEALYDVSRPIEHPETGEFQPILRYQIAYSGFEKSIENGWALTLNMIVDATEVNYLYNAEICRAPICSSECIVSTGYSTYVYLERLGIRGIVGNRHWNPPGGIFDSNILSQPGTLDNVENGRGFVGAGYLLDVPLDPSHETVVSSCFRYSL